MGAFRNQTAVVAGATGAIGEAIALTLAREGANLGLIGRNADKLDALIKKANTAPGVFRAYQTDLTSVEEIRKAVKQIESDYKRVDILIHSAGGIVLGSFEDTLAEALDLQYHINVRAPYVLTQYLLPQLKQQKGQIVFINSSICLQGAKMNVGAYASTKFALKALSDSLREEVNELGIRVLSVYPGRTASPMQVAVHEFEDKTYQGERLLQPQDIADTVVHALSLPRTAEITDISVRPFLKT